MQSKYVEKNFTMGKVLHAINENKIYVWLHKIIYLIVGTLSFLQLLRTPYGSSHTLLIIMVMVAFWGFHKNGQNLIFICEGGILVRRNPVDMNERLKSLFADKYLYTKLRYEEIVGISQKWDMIYIGTLDVGGVYTVPVGLQYLDNNDKILILESIADFKSQMNKHDITE